MSGGLIIAAVTWGVLGIVILLLLFYRSRIAAHEDDTLHVSHDTDLVSEQAVLATKLGAVDRWGKILTIILVVYGLALAGYYIATTMGDPARGL